MLKADGLDEAFVGVVDVDGEPLLAYSLSKVIEVLMGDGMSEQDAMEYYSFNIEGSYVGNGMPLFVDDLRYASIEDAAACEE